MSDNDPRDQTKPIEPDETSNASPEAPTSESELNAANQAEESPLADPGDRPTDGPTDVADASSERRPILIGSQRDPAANLARRTRDWTPIPETDPEDKPKTPPADGPADGPAEKSVPTETPATVEETVDRSGPPVSFPPPNLRDALPADLEEELELALGDAPLEELMDGSDALTGQEALEEDSRHMGRVVAVRRDDVFVEMGSREQGCISINQFDEPPEVGATLEVIVQKFNTDDGLYELALPGKAMSVSDWSDLKEGMLVDAHVTGHNTGGLECEVNHIQGFIPVSQISLYRVDDLAQFVDEKFACLITEANPDRRNLVLSRRAVLEREREEARQKLIESLEPGQVHEGVVRKIVDFGAFVDIGGIDGLLHISQLAWGRVQHPSEVIAEGQNIKVKIEKIDPATGKMSLAYRDLLDNPWDNAKRNYPPNGIFDGTVTKLMDFGAFVELEPGVEGLVHISELSHKRVWRASDVVHEGETIQVMVLSVDPEAQRMSLSIRQAVSEPEPVKKAEDGEPEPLPEKARKKNRPTGPLKGGLGRGSGGEQFGLNW